MSGTKGLIIVHTGDGKGKTTAALGLAFRALGSGFRVLMLQFIKGGWEYGELNSAKKFENFELKPMGEGFIWQKDPESMAKNRRLALDALNAAREAAISGKYFMLILDELNYALSYGLLELKEVMDFLDEKPPELHVVLTGRNAHPDIISRADLVTEMKAVKHPFDSGIKGQKGIEF